MKLTKHTPARMIEFLESRRMLASTIGYVVNYGQEDQADTGYSVAVDSAGNSYVTGTFQAAINVNPLGPEMLLKRGNGNGVFIVKYDPNGLVVWAKRLVGKGDSYGRQIKLGPTGDVYVAGTYSKALRLDGLSEPLMTSAGGQDVFIMRFSNSGRLLWKGSLGGKKDDGVNAMAVGPDGDIYLGGWIRLEGDIDPTTAGKINVKTRGTDDTFIQRLSKKDGRVRWHQVFGERDTGEAMIDLAVDAKGGLLVAGTFQREVEFDRGNSAFTRDSEGKRTDIYYGRLIAKTGKWDYLRTFGSSDTEACGGLALDPAGGAFYLTGLFRSAMEMIPGDDSSMLDPVGEQDVFVAKFNSVGKMVWARQIGGEDATTVATGLAVDPAGNVHATGYFNETVIVDAGKANTELVVDKSGDGRTPFSTVRSSEVYTVKFRSNGALRYAKQIGGDDSGIVSEDITVDAGGNVYLTGSFNGLTNFAPAPGTPVFRDTDDNRRSAAAFLVKILA